MTVCHTPKKESLRAMDPQELEHLHRQLNNTGWNLRFPKALEAEFQHDYCQRYRTHMQLAMFLGVLALLGCGIVDPFWQAQVAAEVWQARLLMVLPMFGLLLLARSRLGERYMQLFTTLGGCISVGGLIAISIHSLEPFNHYYSGAISIVMLVVFVLSRLQFNWGVASAFLMLSILSIGLLVFGKASFMLWTINFFVAAVSAIFALVGTFLIERSLRQNYLQSRLLSFEKLGLEESNLHLQYLNAIDGLTQIANRRSLDITLTTEWQRALRKNEPLGIIMIDVDHFKLFNDTYGHQAGDDCLRGVASALKDFARRPGDIAARYGGEEFVLVLTNATAEQTAMIAERVRDKIVELAIPHQRSSHGSVTASFGVTSIIPSPKGGGPETLLLAADQALYHAKKNGRNRVSIEGEENKKREVA